MRNRITQPRPLDLPPVQNNPVRIYGQLRGPMGQSLAGLRILLKAITTTAEVMQDTWADATTDNSGNYDFSVMPGKYAVFFERRGLNERVNNIYVYSDSAPGTLQSFMLAPSADMLTPLMVLEVKAALEEATAAMLRARQWAENPVDVPVLDFEQGAGPEYSAYHWAHKAEEIVNSDTNINWRGEWSSTTAYAFRDAVRYQGSSYYCIEGNTGTAPPDIATADNAAWSLMSAKGDKGEQGEQGEKGESGADGQDGQNGTDGKDGADGITPDMSDYEKKDDANAKFVTQVRLGAAIDVENSSGNTAEEKSGYVVTMGGDFGSDNGVYRLRPLQYLINGTWGTAASVSATQMSLQSYPVRDIDIFAQAEDTTQLDILNRLSLYSNPLTGHIFSHLIDEQGHDWYQAQKKLAGQVFIAFDPDTGTIEQIDRDVSMLWPENLSVAGLESVPGGCDVDGAWKFDGETVYQDVDIADAAILSANTAKCSTLAGKAVTIIAVINASAASGKPRDGDSDNLLALQQYADALRDVDLTATEPTWPEKPSILL